MCTLARFLDYAFGFARNDKKNEHFARNDSWRISNIQQGIANNEVNRMNDFGIDSAKRRRIPPEDGGSLTSIFGVENGTEDSN